MFPNIDSLGAFNTAPSGTTLAESFEVAAATLEQLNRTESLLDAEGYQCSVVSVVINREQACAAWVEWRYDDTRRIELHEYHLCARTSDARRLSWEIESYNPYFGVYPESLSYQDGVIRLVYRDKHSTRVAEMDEHNVVLSRVLSDPES